MNAPFAGLLLILLFTHSLFIFAQPSKIDSLQAALEKLPADTNRVNTIIELIQTQPVFDEKQILPIVEEAIRLSQKLDFPRGEADLYFHLGYGYYSNGDMPEALE